MALVTDNFNRANGAIGANWTQPPVSGATLNVISNQCGVSANSTFCAGFWNVTTFSSDHYSQAVIGSPATTGGEAVGLMVRSKAGVDEFYMAFVTSAQSQIYSRSAGAFLLLNFVGAASTVGDIIKFEAVGSGPVVLNLYKNGSLLTTYTTAGIDPVINGGSPGIIIFDGGNNLRLDDWQSVDTSEIVSLTGVAGAPAIGAGTIDVAALLVGVEANPVIGTGIVQIAPGPPIRRGFGEPLRPIRRQRKPKREPVILPPPDIVFSGRGAASDPMAGEVTINVAPDFIYIPQPAYLSGEPRFDVSFRMEQSSVPISAAGEVTHRIVKGLLPEEIIALLES